MNIDDLREAIEAAQKALVTASELLKKDWLAMGQRITALEAELAETIRSHQRQNAACAFWEEEHDKLEVEIKKLEEQLAKANR
jgi:chromosome segregation ATPase